MSSLNQWKHDIKISKILSEGGAYKAPQSFCCLYEMNLCIFLKTGKAPPTRKLCLMECKPEMYQGGL
jgi:hypothetical protein